VSATAHPAKFEGIVEPVIGRAVPVPPALAALLDRPTASTPLLPQLPQLAAELDAWT
jgi:threonine synthase